MAEMKQKNMNGIFLFKNNTVPNVYAYTIDPTGKNLPARRTDGTPTSWSASSEIFYFTDEQESEIASALAAHGYYIFTAQLKATFGEWKVVQ